MSDLISREEVLDAIDNADFIKNELIDNGATLLYEDDVVGRIESLPSADMELVVTKETANEITKAFMSGYRYGKEGKDIPKLLQNVLGGADMRGEDNE